MTWELWAMLIAKIGIPAAEEIWNLVQSKQEPTAADWQRLRELAQQTGKSQLIDAIKRAGIDPEDPKAKVLIALAQ